MVKPVMILGSCLPKAALKVLSWSKTQQKKGLFSKGYHTAQKLINIKGFTNKELPLSKTETAVHVWE